MAQNAFDQSHCRICKNLISVYKIPKISIDLKMFCLSRLVFISVYFFPQNGEILQRHLFCMNKQYSCQTFFLTDWRHVHRKNKREISLIYWNVPQWILSEWYLKKCLTMKSFLCMWPDIPRAKNWFNWQ